MTTTEPAPVPAPAPRRSPSARQVLRLGWSLLTNGDVLAELTAFGDSYGDLVRWGTRRRPYVMVRRPEHVERVLVAGHDRYRKSVHYRLIAAVTGEGLLTSEGESWQQQRRLMQPMFAKRHLDDLAAHMTAAVEDFLRGWELAGDARRVDVAEEMSTVTLDVVGRALFGTPLTGSAARLRPAVVTGLRTAVIGARLQLLLSLPRPLVDGAGSLLRRMPLLPPPLGRVRNAMRTIDDVVNGIIDRRRATSASGDGSGADASGEERGDLLALLLAARHDDSTPMSRREVRDEVVTLMLAGHETTANALAWMWHLLADHPHARERLQVEVDAVCGDRTPTPADVERLTWTTACFHEAMRIYPPAWVLEREAIEDNHIDGLLLPRGATVFVPVYLIHHDHRWWPEPEVFDPSRFLPGHSHPRGAYLPFGAGRRICIGANFAQLEATLITAMIAQRFTLDREPGPVQPEATVTLRPRHGLPMTVHRR